MIQIFVDSGANLSAELREQYNIHLPAYGADHQ